MKLKKLLIVFLSLAAVLALSIGLVACGDTEPSGYKLTYAKGAYAATGEPLEEWYEEGEEVTLASASTYALAGHILDKWSDGTNEYEPGATFTMPAHDVKLTAKWIQGDPNAPVVTPTSVGFDDGYFVFTGTVENVTSLYVYLNNTNVSGSNNNYVEATVSEGTFTARLPLSALIAYNKTNTPFNLRYRVDSQTATMENVAKGSLSLSATCNYNEYDFRLAVNSGTGCVAVYYDPAPKPVDPDYTISVSDMYFSEGKFVVEGTCGESVETLILHLHNTNSPVVNVPFEAVIDDGTFMAEIALSQIKNEDGDDPASNAYINVRYERNDEGFSANNNFLPGQNGNADYAVNVTCTDEGKIWKLNADTTRTYLTWTAAPEPVVPDYTISISDMYFSDGKFIVEGTCGADVESITFHLNNTTSKQIDYTFDAVITAETFKAEALLSEIKSSDGTEPRNDYINVRYEWNGDDNGGGYYNLLPGTSGDFVVGQEYRYGEKTWTLKADGSRTYLSWSAVTDAYRITEIRLELVGNAPTLTIAGTTTDAAIEASQLQLLLDKTTGTTEKKYVPNSETEAGKFRFTVELTDLIASIDTATPSQQQAYFLRLYNGDTKIADLNSRWASDLLWERGQIETDDAVYFLMKNTEWSNTGWNTLGIVKVEKNETD